MQSLGDPMSRHDGSRRSCTRTNGVVSGERPNLLQSTGDAQPECDRDRGSVLPLVLVLMIIGSLIVIPTMRYAVSVLKANAVLSDKTMRIESAKAGLRLALADPVKLYDACGDRDRGAGPFTPIQLAPISMGSIDVSTDCYFIDYASAQSAEELRVGVTSTQVGTAPPEALKGTSWCPPHASRTVPCDIQPSDPASSSEWLTNTTLQSATGKIWLPNLPVHGLNRRSPAGNQMPSGFSACTVYFPGTYPDPVVLDGPTYFASGIYYFEKDVRIEGGASVVVGLGAYQGCTNDQEAIFYAENAPSTHNMSGLGGTWVLGAEGRIVVDNSNGSELSIRFNKRYVAPDAAGDAPSQDVSIVSVNGTLATDGVTGIPLIACRESSTCRHRWSLRRSGASDESGVRAIGLHAGSSRHGGTHPACDPNGDSVCRHRVRATWTADPASQPVRTYGVTASPGGDTCEVDMSAAPALECDIVGLAVDTAYTFQLTAINEVGASTPSAPSAAVTPDAGLGAPPAPSPPPPPAPFVPVPIIEVDLPATAAATVEIPGYVAVLLRTCQARKPERSRRQDLRWHFGCSVRCGRRTRPPGRRRSTSDSWRRSCSASSGLSPPPTLATRRLLRSVQVNQNGATAINSWEVQ